MSPRRVRHRPKIKANPRAAAALVRRRQALALRLAGSSYEEIKETLGVSKSSAFEMVQSALDDVVEEVRGDAARLVAESVTRLDRLLRAVWPAAIGSPATAKEPARPPNLRAVERAQAIIAQRDKLLRLTGPETLIVDNRQVHLTRDQALADGRARRELLHASSSEVVVEKRALPETNGHGNGDGPRANGDGA